MSSGVKVVSDVQHLNLVAMEAMIGSDFHGKVLHFGSVGSAAEDEFIDNRGDATGLNVATVLAFHELAVSGIIRNPVGSWTDANKRNIGDVYRDGVEDILDGLGDADDAAEMIGEFAAQGIEDFITGDEVRPELGDWWIGDPWRDQGGVPLFDTGQIAGSMSFEIDPG